MIEGRLDLVFFCQSVQFEFEHRLLTRSDVSHLGAFIVIEEYRFFVPQEVQKMIVLAYGVPQIYPVNVPGVWGDEISRMVEISCHYWRCLCVVVTVDNGIALKIAL